MGLPPVLAQRLSLPVVASPLFLCSGPELVKAECQAGVIGSFPALNARPSSLLGDWLDEIEESNAAYALANPDAIVAPFAVNQIVHRSNDRLEHDMGVIVEHKVPIVITSLGARPEINDAVHSYGGIVLHDIINNEFAHKAIDKGADGIIAVAAGAGGHAGTQSPSPWSAKSASGSTVRCCCRAPSPMAGPFLRRSPREPTSPMSVRLSCPPTKPTRCPNTSR